MRASEPQMLTSFTHNTAVYITWPQNARCKYAACWCVQRSVDWLLHVPAAYGHELYLYLCQCINMRALVCFVCASQ